MKYLFYIIIGVLIGFIAYLYFKPIDTTEFDRMTRKNDSLSTLIAKDKLTIQNLLKDVEITEIKEVEYLEQADSLAKIISTLKVADDCPKIVKTQGKEIVVLRQGLKECNKSKGIYKVTLGVCQNIVVKHELKEINNDVLNNTIIKKAKKSKRKAFLLGSASGAVLVLWLLLLL